MPSRPERSRARLFAYGFLVLLALLAVIPGYLVVERSWRPLVVRLACGLVVAVAGVRLVGGVRRAADDAPPSPLDTAPPPRRPPVADERFLRLRDDVIFSTRSQRYFETFLWPKLRKLGGPGLTAPAPRRRRGPSPQALERVIADLERGS
jgi:hypothetical protein